MKKLLLALAVFVSLDVAGQSCNTSNPRQLYARLEDIRFADQFGISGDTTTQRAYAAALDL
jgi:hypothetical protein